ncbi:hypothetical protein ACTJIK_04015 [Chitinophaga sp. 22620]
MLKQQQQGKAGIKLKKFEVDKKNKWLGQTDLEYRKRIARSARPFQKTLKKGRKSLANALQEERPARKKAIPMEPGNGLSMHNNKIITNPAGKRRSAAQRS